MLLHLTVRDREYKDKQGLAFSFEILLSEFWSVGFSCCPCRIWEVVAVEGISALWCSWVYKCYLLHCLVSGRRVMLIVVGKTTLFWLR